MIMPNPARLLEQGDSSSETASTVHPADTRQINPAQKENSACGHERVTLTPQKQKKYARLTPRQNQFLDAINEEGRYRLDHAMYKAGVRRRRLERWLGDPLFLKALHRRVLGLELNQYMFLHYCQPIAADRLLTLMHYNKGEVVQKACANLFHMVKHGRRLEKEYLPDQSPSLDPAPDPRFVTNQIKYGKSDEEFVEQYQRRMQPEIPNPQDYF